MPNSTMGGEDFFGNIKNNCNTLSRHNVKIKGPNMLKFSYNEQDDVLEVEGIKYHGDIFRQLSGLLPPNHPFMIVGRVDGVLTIKPYDLPLD